MLYDYNLDDFLKDIMQEEYEKLCSCNCNDSENDLISDEDADSFLNRISDEKIVDYIKKNGRLNKELDNLYENGEIDFIDIDKNCHYNLDATESQIKIIYDELIEKKFIKQTNFQDFYYACTGKNKPESYLGIAWIGQRNQCAYFIRTLFGKEKNLWHIGYNVFNIKLLSQSYYNLFNISKNTFSKKTEPINNILKKANISFKD